MYFTHSAQKMLDVVRLISCFDNYTAIVRRKYHKKIFFLFLARRAPPPTPQWARAFSFTRFLDHTQRATMVGRTLLDEWSARHRDLYLTTRNTHNRQTSTSPVVFESTISAGERP